MREAGAGRVGTLHYGRTGTPTQWALAEALTALEPGEAGTRLYPSGVAAISIALMTVLRPGDELLLVDSTYAPTRAFCVGVLSRQVVPTRYYVLLSGPWLPDPFAEKPLATFLEQPGSVPPTVQ